MDRKIAAARCHEIQLTIRDKEVPRFEGIPEIGMQCNLRCIFADSRHLTTKG